MIYCYGAFNAENMGNAEVILEKGKDKAIRNRHHWIFSGAIRHMPEFEDGDILPVRSENGDLLGHAYFNSQSSIAGRMVSFGSEDPHDAIRLRIQEAAELRRRSIGSATTAYRLINSEGDFLPGLIADFYAGIIVLQFSTLGMEKLKDLVVQTLNDILSPAGIYEKSNLSSRKHEGLPAYEGMLSGSVPERMEILENGLRFAVNFRDSQKTGFYLDQRETRLLVQAYSSGRTVLNCFSYTGAFSVYAARGGAVRTISVDASDPALDIAAENFRLNGMDEKIHTRISADAFEYLRSSDVLSDFIILDPPAFAKRKTDVVAAARGYKDINRLALARLLPRSLLLSCSCSHFVDEKLFQQIIFQASAEAGRRVRIIQRHRLAPDHPINIFHPEGEYLKSMLLAVE